MRSKAVQIRSEATITVPARLWPKLVEALCKIHNERCHPWANKFVTDTSMVPSQSALWCAGANQKAMCGFLFRTWAALGPYFKGDLTFVKKGGGNG